jgi:hypothetical protein
LLDFEECIDVIFEETISMFRKMPHFVYLEEMITLLEGFFQFQTHPCAMYCSLSVCVGRVLVAGSRHWYSRGETSTCPGYDRERQDGRDLEVVAWNILRDQINFSRIQNFQ